MILEPKKIIPLLGIQHGMTILDIGSGVGFWTKPIVDLVGASGAVIAVDYDPAIIQRLNHDITEMGIKNVHAITGDIHRLATFPVKHYSCDRVLMIRMGSVIHDLYADKVLELLEYVNDSGQLIIIDHADYQPRLEKDLARFLNQLEHTSLALVEERSNGHFFGMTITRTVE
jgi:cyclopropane fatty-acyl-phospholipid synthase-like methyltransferase